jgi:hypothetical protein
MVRLGRRLKQVAPNVIMIRQGSRGSAETPAVTPDTERGLELLEFEMRRAPVPAAR